MRRFVVAFVAAAITVSVAVTAGSTERVRDEPVWSVATRHRVVALTFDDGPDRRWTPSILAILHRERVHATFFVLGPSAERDRSLIRHEETAQNEIGCHGWIHVAQIDMPTSQVLRSFRDCASVVEAITHARPRLVRAPYGLLSASQVRAFAREHRTVVDWTFSPSPFLDHPRELAHSLERVEPGEILLLHDGRDNRHTVVRELPRIIRDLRRRHFHFVTVDQLIRDGRIRYEHASTECARERMYSLEGYINVPPLAASGCRMFA